MSNATRPRAPYPFANHRNEIERQIIVQLVSDLLGAGFTVQVNDGEEDVTPFVTDAHVIYAAMSTTDEEILFLRHPDKPGKISWVKLIYGNDCDVIHDYTIDLEPHMSGAEKLSERFGG